MKVLITDDNKSITDTVSKFLGFKKFDCKVANDGRNGLELIRNESFDVVLLDLAMPGFSGFDVLEELKKNNQIESNNIIILTATPISSQENNILKKYGIKQLLKKPTDMTTLIKHLETFSPIDKSVN